MQTTTSRRSLKEKQRQEREELILQVAEEVLAEKGYHNTSIDEIAMRVGIAKGTVYLHFDSKEDLVAALFERDLEQFLHSIEQKVASEQTPCAKLEGLFQCMYGGWFSKRFQLLSAIHNSPDSRKIFAEKKGSMGGFWEELAARISALLEEGKAAGEFDPTLPTSVMLSTFFSLLSPRGYERLLIEGKMQPDELVQHLGRIYFRGIAAV